MREAGNDSDSSALHYTNANLIDQLSHLIPQIHLTLTSVLQAVALAFLLTSFHAPQVASPEQLLIGLLDLHFYLPQIVSFLVIIIAWNQFAYAAFFLRWPLTAFSTILQFLVAAVEIAAFVNVNAVGTWAIWIGVAALLAAYIQRHNRRISAPELYPYGNIAAQPTWYYWAIGIVVLTLGALRYLTIQPFSYALAIGAYHATLFDLLLPLVLFGVGVIFIRQDDAFYIREVNNIFVKSGSRYRMDRHGRIGTL